MSDEEIEEILSIIEQIRDVYSNIIESTFGKEILFDKDYHQLFVGLVTKLLNELLSQGYIGYYFNLSQTLFRYNKRISSHRFTRKQLADFDLLDSKNLQENDILDHFRKIDNSLKVIPENINDLRKTLNDLTNLWEEKHYQKIGINMKKN